MTTVAERTGVAPRTTRVLGALALVEARRMVLNPLLWAGAAMSAWGAWTVAPDPDEWVGSSYIEAAVSIIPFLFAVSVLSAISFHRERIDVAGAAPTDELHRFAARLAATVPFGVVALALTALMGWRQRDVGGLVLGVEPGRTADALYTAGELAQPVALTVLAVAFGAAVGRRMTHLVSAMPLVFVLWLAMSVYWFYSDRRVTPFSIVQVQPIRVHAGAVTADPLTFPASWLLEAPDEFTDAWMRVVVSEPLAWWHAVWLLGLSALWLAAALPSGPSRRPMLMAGATLAVLGVGAQYAVLR